MTVFHPVHYALIALLAFAASPALGASDITFGAKPLYQDGDQGGDYAASKDGKAFSFRFSDFQVDIGRTKESPKFVASRSFAIVVPAAGHDKDVELKFSIQGFVEGRAKASGDASATIVLNVNGQTAVGRFPATQEEAFQQSLLYKTTGGDTEFRISVAVILERDSNFTIEDKQGKLPADFTMGVQAIDGNIPIN